MNRLILTAVAAIMILAASCDGIGSGSSSSSSSSGTTSKKRSSEPIEVTITGVISHTEYTPGQSATVTFSRFPQSVAEFKQVREQIGKEPQGAVALQVMAFEMFRHDRKIGRECIEMNTVNSGVDAPIRRLGQLFGNDANYARPYQMAGFLKGATPENGYSPSKPYTVEMSVKEAYQETGIFQSHVIPLKVNAPGRKNGSIAVSVLKTHKPDEPSNGTYFIVFGCGDLFFQVEPISFTATFNGLD